MINIQLQAPGADVLAVIVAYNGGDKLSTTIAALRPQVGRILVVDNGSDDNTLVSLREHRDRGEIELTELGVNRGLGVALNIGATRAVEEKFSWLLTMDQDSVARADMVASMLRYAQRVAGTRVMSPNITVHGREPAKLKQGPVDYAITSGNLVHTEVLCQVGAYDEHFFIDCVDFDYSLRMRAAGFDIHKDPAARLYHELGEQVPRRRPLDRFYTQHSALRRYYMFRNGFYLARRHGLHFPRFVAKLMAGQLLLLALILVYDPVPGRSLRMIGRGVLDFLRGRQGMYLPTVP